jgi:hypothetical protein
MRKFFVHDERYFWQIARAFCHSLLGGIVSRFYSCLLAFLAVLFVGLAVAVAPPALAAGPAAPSAKPTPTPTPSPTLVPLTGAACDVKACTSACQMNNPERGVKETCVPSCTTLIQNRKRNKQCK